MLVVGAGASGVDITAELRAEAERERREIEKELEITRAENTAQVQELEGYHGQEIRFKRCLQVYVSRKSGHGPKPCDPTPHNTPSGVLYSITMLIGSSC